MAEIQGTFTADGRVCNFTATQRHEIRGAQGQLEVVRGDAWHISVRCDQRTVAGETLAAAPWELLQQLIGRALDASRETASARVVYPGMRARPSSSAPKETEAPATGNP